jgi:hypothetical protein
VFSLGLGESLKEDGLAQIEESNEGFVWEVRRYAELFCSRHGSVTSDDLRRYAIERGIAPNHQNAWGAVFRGGGWRVVGRKKSEFASNHGREIRIWSNRPG